jgi:hypothetical protein
LFLICWPENGGKSNEYAFILRQSPVARLVGCHLWKCISARGLHGRQRHNRAVAPAAPL